ncbi:MAG: alanine dehydrogenase, partial [Firmicutes bacterium]|nr:alanine dehydrogenase [Bacillota bacterium]
PIFVLHDVIHYCVANIPGAVPKTATLALTNVTLPYAVRIANKGWKQALIDEEPLRKGANVLEGKIVYKSVAEAFDLPYVPVEEALGMK